MFAGKAGAFQRKARFKCSTLGQAFGLIKKHYFRLDNTDWDMNVRMFAIS